jgi:hypothetical protein
VIVANFSRRWRVATWVKQFCSTASAQNLLMAMVMHWWFWTRLWSKLFLELIIIRNNWLELLFKVISFSKKSFFFTQSIFVLFIDWCVKSVSLAFLFGFINYICIDLSFIDLIFHLFILTCHHSCFLLVKIEILS